VTAAADADLRAWLEALARDLVDQPERVDVRLVVEEGVDVLELEVAQEELGRVIGRQGRTAQALRALLAVASEKHGRSYELEILD
jgi:predicted RNA-binding protein YlqC (UPF0109 family)